MTCGVRSGCVTWVGTCSFSLFNSRYHESSSASDTKELLMYLPVTESTRVVVVPCINIGKTNRCVDVTKKQQIAVTCYVLLFKTGLGLLIENRYYCSGILRQRFS